MLTARRLLVFALLGMILLACDSPFPTVTPGKPDFALATLNPATNRPTADYVKDVAVYREGDGLIIYFILADKFGQMVSAKGKATLSITDSDDETLYKKTANVYDQDFYWTKVGIGEFEHDALICSFGRIKYSQLSAKPEGRIQVDLYFDAGGSEVLHGEDFTYV